MDWSRCFPPQIFSNDPLRYYLVKRTRFQTHQQKLPPRQRIQIRCRNSLRIKISLLGWQIGTPWNPRNLLGKTSQIGRRNVPPCLLRPSPRLNAQHFSPRLFELRTRWSCLWKHQIIRMGQILEIVRIDRSRLVRPLRSLLIIIQNPHALRTRLR